MENTSVILPSGNYRVEKILGISIDQDNGRSFKVQLVPSWVSERNLAGCEKMITDFLKEQQEKVVINTEPNTRFSNQVKVEDEDVCQVVQESYGPSCDENVHFHSNKSFTSFKETSINTSNTLVSKELGRNISAGLNNIECLEIETQNSIIEQEHSEQSHLQELLPHSMQEMQQGKLKQLQQHQQLQQQHQQLQQQQLQQQKQQQIQQQAQPSYEFLISFYMENVEHIKGCKTCKIQKLQKLGDNQGGTLSFNYEEDIFQPYSGGHSMFLHVANNIIERRDLMSKGNNKIERIKAVEEILTILDIQNTIENTQRISKRLGKLINSKKHATKIKKNAAKLGISYNRYRSKYAKRRSENEVDNVTPVTQDSTVSNEVPSQEVGPLTSINLS